MPYKLHVAGLNFLWYFLINATDSFSFVWRILASRMKNQYDELFSENCLHAHCSSGIHKLPKNCPALHTNVVVISFTREIFRAHRHCPSKLQTESLWWALAICRFEGDSKSVYVLSTTEHPENMFHSTISAKMTIYIHNLSKNKPSYLSPVTLVPFAQSELFSA